jgi:hypothetical protein
MGKTLPEFKLVFYPKSLIILKSIENILEGKKSVYTRYFEDFNML